jgi:benzoyl-CoA reductase/2-hydroxyglutaryl-CoA dehydratase subunit BcrC/BadD/HgdB
MRSSLTARRLAEAMASPNFDVRTNTDRAGTPTRNGRTRLALVGGPLLREDFAIYDLVEEGGGTIVLDGTEHGERAMPARFDRRRLRDDPLGELADAYFGAIRDAFRRPNDELFAWLGRELVERDVQGVIYHSYVWCDTWEAEAHRLKEWSPVPVLLLSSGDGDGDAAKRIAGQVQAFLEVVA